MTSITLVHFAAIDLAVPHVAAFRATKTLRPTKSEESCSALLFGAIFG